MSLFDVVLQNVRKDNTIVINNLSNSVNLPIREQNTSLTGIKIVEQNPLAEVSLYQRHKTDGAQASAVIYSLVETAKANNLKIYDYLKHLLSEIPKHMDDANLGFLDDLLPWSTKLPEECHKKI